MSGISDAVDISGRLVKLAKTTMTLDLQEQIMELRAAVLNAQKEILRLREERNELQRTAALRDEMEFDGAIYWRKLPDGQKEGPFCPRCLDVDSKAVRLQHYPNGWSWPWKCMQCDKGYPQK